jgi:hypothetical protein
VRRKAVVLMIVGVLVAACGQPAVHYGQGELRQLTCSTDKFGTRSCGGLIAAPAGLTDSIHLDKTKVVAGSTVKGTLIVTNASGHTVNLLYRGCRPNYGIALTNGTIIARPAAAASCSRSPLVLKPGVTKLPTYMITTYQSCTSGPPSPKVPQCAANGNIPPLPAGRYLAVLDGLDLALPPAQPVPVTLVNRG